MAKNNCIVILSSIRNTYFMTNKPRIPEGSSSNLLRTALLLVLTPACATTIELPVCASIRTSVKEYVSGQPLKTKHSYVKKVCMPVPIRIDDQYVQISGMTKKKHSSTRESDGFGIKAKSYERIEDSIIIDPVIKPEGECKTIPIADILPLSNGTTADEYNNIDLLSIFVRHLPSYINSEILAISNTTSKNSCLVGTDDTLLCAKKDKNESFASEETEIIFGQTLYGYQIERTVNNVKFSAQLVVCDKQRKEKAANIAAEIRGKLAKGSKEGNRR
jgi:hypothetical protein